MLCEQLEQLSNFVVVPDSLAVFAAAYGYDHRLGRRRLTLLSFDLRCPLHDFSQCGGVSARRVRRQA